MDAIAAFADHVVATRFQDLPPEALRAAKIFILDTRWHRGQRFAWCP